MYRPNEAAQMTTPFQLLKPVKKARVNGILPKDSFEAVEGIIFANCKTFGGTERTDNGVLIVEDTANICCWYRPDIQSDCRMKRMTDNAVFEIIGEPENIEMRNQILKFKIRRVKGGA